MKEAILYFALCLLPAQAIPQSYGIDSAAVYILDRMSAVMGDLNSVSATIKTNYDVSNSELGLVKHSDEEHAYMQGPDKLLFTSEGDKGSRSFYYNGTTLSYYSMDRNQYAQIRAAGGIIDMIDEVHKKYGIFFPIADFLYPGFVDDLLAETSDLVYLGNTGVNGKECYHIAGRSHDKTFQFWIADDAYYLPVKLVIVYTSKELDPQFEESFTSWKINPSLPDAIFQFNAPNAARKVKMPLLHPAKNNIR